MGLFGRTPVTLLLLSTLLATMLSGCSRDDSNGGSRTVTLGVGSTDEQRMLAALTVVALRDAGFSVQTQTELGGTVALRREGLRSNIDLWWDYTGAAWALGLGEQAPPADPVESFQRVQRADEDRGLTWLEPSSANATLALFVRADDVPAEDSPRGLSWLAGVLSRGEERLCADRDFVRRRGGLDAFAEAYAIELGRIRVMAANEAEAVIGVAEERCFAGLATATSGPARAAGLAPVADELAIFPAFIVAPVVRAAVLARLPELRAALAPLAGVLDTRALGELNGEVARGRDPGELAAAFLAQIAPPEG